MQAVTRTFIAAFVFCKAICCCSPPQRPRGLLLSSLLQPFLDSLAIMSDLHPFRAGTVVLSDADRAALALLGRDAGCDALASSLASGQSFFQVWFLATE